MAGIASIALGAAPVLGGALLGVAAGQLRGPDLRGGIKQDLELLQQLPPDEVTRRESLRRSINDRVDDLIAATEQRRRLRAAASSYEGNWRDIVLFLCAVLFTIVWWHVSHARTNWLPVFVVMILACLVTAGYAFRGIRRSMRRVMRRQQRRHPGVS
jgi:hypothetical protein